jgi:Putative rhamnosyl transferase
VEAAYANSSSPESHPAPKFGHVILTRFNVRYVGPGDRSIGLDADWLQDRFDLFERFCLPSVLSQNQKQFVWLIFFDEATPEPFASRARNLSREHPNIYTVFSGALPLSAVKEAVNEVLPNRPDWLLTTRLDNDDGLHPEFVSTVQLAQRFEQAEVLNCPIGMILSGNRAYQRRDDSNAFISLSEPFSSFETIFSILRHVYAGESFPVRQVGSGPLWLQVVHPNNISNRIRGRRIRLANAAQAFPTLNYLRSHRERSFDVARENIFLYPIRSARDIGISGMRRIARLFGIDLRRKAKKRPPKAIT